MRIDRRSRIAEAIITIAASVLVLLFVGEQPAVLVLGALSFAHGALAVIESAIARGIVRLIVGLFILGGFLWSGFFALADFPWVLFLSGMAMSIGISIVDIWKWTALRRANP